MKFKILAIIALCLLILPRHSLLKGQTKNMEVLRSFPSDDQMEKNRFFLQMPHRFCLTDDYVFICDQAAHKVYKLDMEGNLAKVVGGHGQGPGEFQLPLNICVYENKLYVGDNGNARIDIFSLAGVFERSIKVINPLHDFVIINDRIFDLMFRSVPADVAELPIMGIFSMEGEILKKIYEPFMSSYNERKYNNRVRLREVHNEIHALQMYGTTYRIYGIDGEKQRDIELKNNPLDDEEYRSLGYLYTFTSFDTWGGRIYASKVAKGRIEIFVFDMAGKFLHKNVIKGDAEKIYYVNDMRIVNGEKNPLLYLLMWEPEIRILVTALQ